MASTAENGAEATQRAAIVAAALARIQEEGSAGLRMRKVAAEAGCSTMVIYTHFGGKNGLVEALRLDGFAELRGALVTAAGRSEGRRRILRLAAAYRVWALENPTHYEVMFTRAVHDYTPTEAARAIGIRTFDVLVDAVASAARGGEIRGRDPRDVAYLIWGIVHGHVMLELAAISPRPGPLDREDALRQALAACLRGLKPVARTGASRPTNR